MQRYGRRRSSRMRWWLGGGVLLVAIGAGWWYFRPARLAEKSKLDDSTGVVAGSTVMRQPESGKPAAKPAGQTPAPSGKPAPTPAPVPAPKPAAPTTTQPAVPRPTTQPSATQPHPLSVPGVPPLIPTSRPVSTQSTSTQPGASPSTTSLPADPYATPTDPTAARAHDDTRTGNSGIESARRLVDADKMLEARQSLQAMLKRGGLSPTEDREVRALLTRIADETVFGKKTLPGDPLIDTYTIQSGDVLEKVGKKLGAPAEALMLMNGISDARRIRAEQKIKVPKQAFYAKIYKSQFRLDLYLGDTYLRSYRVGLGAEGGTPEGVWKVENRLKNPTYFPSESAKNKTVIAPNDPNNPLGEWWIGLEGVEGAAVGHKGYGIHGTIEPESIGKAVSLGCIRMLNEDVAVVWKLMQPGRSMVYIVP